MPNRYQKEQHRELVETIARYEGYYCLACYIEGAGRRKPPEVELEIDHAGKERHLLCKTHNLKMRRLSLQMHESVMAVYSAENEKKRKKENIFEHEVHIKVDYSNGSPEMQARSVMLRRWFEFMHGRIDANEYVTKEDAIYGGADYCGGSSSTTYRFLRENTWAEGRFQQVVQDGERVIIYRNGVKP